MSDTKKPEGIKDDVKDTKKTSEAKKADTTEKKTAAKSTAASKAAETKKTETKKADTAKKEDKAETATETKADDKTEKASDSKTENADNKVDEGDASLQTEDAETQREAVQTSHEDRPLNQEGDDSESLQSTDKSDDDQSEDIKETSDSKLQLKTVRFRGLTPVYMHPSKKSASAKVQGIVFVSGKTAGNFAEILAVIPGIGKTKCYVEKQRVGVK